MTHTNLDGKSSLSMKLIQGSPNLVIKDSKDTLISNFDPNERKQISRYFTRCSFPRYYCCTDLQFIFNLNYQKICATRYFTYVSQGAKNFIHLLLLQFNFIHCSAY